MKLSADARSIILLGLLSACLWATRLRGPIDLRWDAGTYYVLGTSLAEGKGYRLLNEPGEIEAIQYPPLLPALVAAYQLALGTSDPDRVGHGLRITYAILFTLYTILVYRLARHYARPIDSFLVAVIAALPVHVVFLSDILFAELPYALITVAFAVWSTGPDPEMRGSRWRLVASATAAGMAFLARTSGLALLAAWVGDALLRGRWRLALLRGGMAILPVVAWQGYVGHVRAGEAYRHPAYEYQRAPYLYYNVAYDENARLIDPFMPELGQASASALAGRFAGNVASIPAMLGRALFTGRGGHDASPGLLAAVSYVVLGILILAGLGALARRRDRFIPLYIAASLALICTTPWPSQFGRYLAPLAPFLALALILLLRAVAGRLPLGERDGAHPARSAFVLAAALAMVAKQAYSDANVMRARSGQPSEDATRYGLSDARYFFSGPQWASYDVALQWLGDHAKPGEVVASAAPQQAYLWAGLKSVMFPMEPDPREAQRLLDGVPARYLILDGLDINGITRRYAAPVVSDHPDAWELIYASSEGLTQIYRRKPGPGTAGLADRPASGPRDGMGRLP